MNDKIVIFQDGDTKIEIDRFFHYYLQQIKPLTFKLDDEEFDAIAQITLNLIEQKKLNLKKPSFIRNIPVIKSGYGINLRPPYESFNDILHYIAMYPNLDDSYINIEEDINDCFKEQGFLFYIFPHRIFDVKGFIIKKEENESTILLFGFENNTQNIDFLDFL